MKLLAFSVMYLSVVQIAFCDVKRQGGGGGIMKVVAQGCNSHDTQICNHCKRLTS